MTARWRGGAGLTGLLTLLLVGCAEPRLADLEQQLTTIRANPGAARELELPEVPTYRPVPYREADSRSPFQSRLPESERSPEGGGELQPDPEREREPLEAYSLEELRLVGVLTVGGEPSALIREPGGEVHRLRVGDYLGANHGRIADISGSAVELVELVPTGGGGWMERSTRIRLNSD